jgi:predicted enzyme related to lactoylglutathione lyase
MRYFFKARRVGCELFFPITASFSFFFSVTRLIVLIPESLRRGRIMEKVTGIGGIFFRADDTEKLAVWYEQHLGVSPVPSDYEQQPWQQQAGATVFAPFARDTEYFDRDSQQWMINFRVADLDAMVVQLLAAGIKVAVDDNTYPNGRFARLHDPEGNPIELWEPAE